jgi:hypothetical protein
MRIDDLINQLQEWRKSKGNIDVCATWEGITTEIKSLFISQRISWETKQPEEVLLMDVDEG